MSDPALIEKYRSLAAQTTIDSNTLLSTDYFNHFNEVIMLMSMLGDMPDMLDEIAAWKPKSYLQHFAESGLAFAPLAIACYSHVVPGLRDPFEATVAELDATVAEAVEVLSGMRDDPDRFAHHAAEYWKRLQDLVDRGSAIVHGTAPEENMGQDAIDALF